ncbi:MAG: hypothetical protein H6707_06850 [Deltaproteobacteria bacterium]|nr:hypothetical protein [Deltaproteobacteria bacterium]
MHHARLHHARLHHARLHHARLHHARLHLGLSAGWGGRLLRGLFLRHAATLACCGGGQKERWVSAASGDQAPSPRRVSAGD